MLHQQGNTTVWPKLKISIRFQQNMYSKLNKNCIDSQLIFINIIYKYSAVKPSKAIVMEFTQSVQSTKLIYQPKDWKYYELLLKFEII